jgi:hypothetical protein
LRRFASRLDRQPIDAVFRQLLGHEAVGNMSLVP